MRGLGTILILTASLVAAFQLLDFKKRRIKDLRCACRILELTEAEMGTSLVSIPELCLRIENSADKETAGFFSCLSEKLKDLGNEEFSHLWQHSAAESLPALSVRELSDFSSLGDILGRYDLGHQLDALNNTLSGLRSVLKEAELTYPAQQRLSLGLSAAGALLMVIGLL